MKKNIPLINVISFSVYYGFRTIAALIFVVSLVPISVIFGRIFPVFFRVLADRIDQYVQQEHQRIDRDWVRLGGTLPEKSNDS
jgi:uncharacterized membrane protein YraQ (UPF0718 family)